MSGPSRASTAVPVVELRGITRAFGAIQALRGVDLDLLPGEVHSLVGANGAGKSTLAKIVAGVLAPDAGTVRIGGRQAERATFAAHRALGVAALYQETTIVPNMTAAANALLSRPRRRGPLIDRGQMRRDFGTRCTQLGTWIDPDVPAGILSVAQQRTIEIIRALDGRHKVLLMDEPTGSLGPDERGRFYAVVRDLASSGISILYISHDLDEVLGLSDRVSVMRDGTLIDTRSAAEWSKAALVEAMLGRAAEAQERPARRIIPDVALAVRDVSVPGRLDRISFDLHRGEILGIAGLVGSGRTELLRAIGGLGGALGGRLSVGGSERPLPTSVREALSLGIAMTPEDRRRAGIVPALTGEENIVLTDLATVSRFGVVDTRRRHAAAERVAGSIGLPPRMLGQPAATLSGGNQQKLVIGRWLHRLPAILLLDEPTIGIDVGAKRELLDFVRTIADQGTSIVLVSAEWEELIDASDRILVLAGGRIVGSLTHGEASVDRILRLVFAVEEAA